jgi:hypothetical protein
MPEAGMFVMLDVRASGVAAPEFALRLLAEEGVALTPTDEFGPSGAGHVRLGLAAPDDRLAEACRRIARFADGLAPLGQDLAPLRDRHADEDGDGGADERRREPLAEQDRGQ